MNNSDYNDFKNWQNGDDNEMNNPNNWNYNNGFLFYGPASDGFKKLWNHMNNNDEYIENMKEYLNMDDFMNKWKKIPQKPNKQKKQNKEKVTIFSQEDYMKLIEIRGYLAITEQMAHVKALDKLLNQIKIVPKDII